MALRGVERMRVVSLCSVADWAQMVPRGADEVLSVPRVNGDVRLMCNAAGRLMVEYPVANERSEQQAEGSTPTKLRSVVLATHNSELFAFDRKCYHVGYPLDLGPIEEIPACSKAMERGKRSTSSVQSWGSDNAIIHAAGCRPAKLVCDGLEESDAAVEESYACVTCPLHNRVFDLRSGDMMAISVVSSATGDCVPSDAPDAQCNVTPTSCKQRIHKVMLLRLQATAPSAPQLPLVSTGLPEGCEVVGEGEVTLNTDIICFIDSFGHSNPVSRKSDPNCSGGPRRQLPWWHVPGVKVPSDSQ